MSKNSKYIILLERLLTHHRNAKLDYLKAAGGFFRDTTIHDFDLTRFILGDDPVVQVSALGGALYDKNSQKIKRICNGQHDSRKKQCRSLGNLFN